MSLLLALACTSAPDPVDTHRRDSVVHVGTDDTSVDTSWPDDTDPPDTGPVDADQDGVAAADDCDDSDPSAYPGAVEAWDGVDNDCDGVIDAVGSYTGNVSLSAAAWYEGERYDFSLQCPTTLERGLVDADFAIVCTTNPANEDAQRMLGATVTLSPHDTHMWELKEWEGDVDVVSSNGWDTLGAGTVRWTSMTRATVAVTLNTRYLDLSGSGSVTR